MASFRPKSLLLFSLFNVKKHINKQRTTKKNKQLEYFNLKLLIFEMLKPFGSMSSTHLSKAGFLCELPCPKHAWEHHWCQDPVSDHMLYFRCQTSLRECLYIFAFQKKKKEKRKAHASTKVPSCFPSTLLLPSEQIYFWMFTCQEAPLPAAGSCTGSECPTGPPCPGMLCHPSAGTRRCTWCCAIHGQGHSDVPPWAQHTALQCMCVPVLHVMLLHNNAPLFLQGKADCL